MNKLQYAGQNVVCHYHQPSQDAVREGLDSYQEDKEKWKNLYIHIYLVNIYN